MKKIFLFFAVCLFSLNCFALDLGNTIEKLPDLKQGIGYSFFDNELTYLTTAEIAKYKDFSFEVGYDAKDKIIGAISVNVIKFEDYITIPYLKELEANLGLYAGYGRLGSGGGNNEYDAGVSVTLLNIEF